MPISSTPTAAEINVELGRAATDLFSINGAEERALAQVPSGPISFNDFIGKSAGPVGPVILADTEFTAGTGNNFNGYSRAAGRNFGSMVDNSYRSTQTVSQIATNLISGQRIEFGVEPSVLPKSDFANISIVGITDPAWNGGETILQRADAQYDADFNGTTFWFWPSIIVAPLVVGHTYRLVVTGNPPTDEFTMTAGASGNFIGFSSYSTIIGSLSPATIFGLNVTRVTDTRSVDGYFRFSLETTFLPQGFLGTVTVEGITDPAWNNGGQSFDFSAPDLYVASEQGNTAWFWNIATRFVNGHQYRVLVTQAAYKLTGRMTAQINPGGSLFVGYDNGTGNLQAYGTWAPDGSPTLALRRLSRQNSSTSAIGFPTSVPDNDNTGWGAAIITGITDPAFELVIPRAQRNGTPIEGANRYWQYNSTQWPFVDGHEYTVRIL